MTVAPDSRAPATAAASYPTRFREAEDRSRRIGRALRHIAGVHELDEDLMHRVGRGMTTYDAPGHRLAEAIRTRVVTMAQVRTALQEGIDAVEDAPAPLRDFFAHVEQTPDWVDWDLLRRGQRAYHLFGQAAADTLTVLSLIGGYRFGGPTDLLVATGGLKGERTLRRLAETEQWTTSLAGDGALTRFGDGWKGTVHVRIMHALVNSSFAPRWDVERWGQPINDTDQAGTLGLFDGTAMLGVRALGVPVSRADSRAVMHLWKYVGWLMGVDEQWLVDSERERHRLNYHILMAQADISEAGPQLARAIVEAQRERCFPRFQRIRGRYERERLLSLMTPFLGVASMREFGLPVRPPWAYAASFALNFWRYRIRLHLPGGRAALHRWADRVVERSLASHFGADSRELGALKT